MRSGKWMDKGWVQANDGHFSQVRCNRKLKKPHLWLTWIFLDTYTMIISFSKQDKIQEIK